MSTNKFSSNKNMKAVLRTALVGLKPADQVILKGYLRVLLRLETDFEWVSANHPHVDLFFINDEFREANSILKLLSMQEHKPVLYVTRAPKGENSGGLHGDILRLPIKQMDILNNWLFDNVVMLQPFSVGNFKTAMSETDNSEQIDPKLNILKSNSSRISHQEHKIVRKDTAFANSANTLNSIQEEINTKNKNNTPILQETAKTIHRNVNDSKGIVDVQQHTATAIKNSSESTCTDFHELIKTFKLKTTGNYKILENDKLIATVNLDKNLIWPMINVYNTSHHNIFYWKVIYCNTLPQKTEDAQNLKQWLWRASVISSDKFTVLADKSQSFKIDYWVKPEKSERSQVLAIQTAIEKSDATIEQIIERTALDETTVQRLLARLLFSGYLHPKNYVDLPIINKNIESNIDVGDNLHESSTNQSFKNITKQATIDDVLSRRASGEKEARQPSSVILDDALSSKKTSIVIEEKPSFLSRLRKKLGL